MDGKPQAIHFARKYWNDLGARITGMNFTEEELDKAEKHPQGFIGNSTDGRYACYLITFTHEE